MATLTEQRGLYMTPAQWAGLEAVAAATKSIARSGPGARKPSWRTLITRIAEGEVIFVEREPYILPAALIEQADAIEAQQREEQREQERLEEQRRRVEMHTVQKQAVRKVPVKMTQIQMNLEPA